MPNSISKKQHHSQSVSQSNRSRKSNKNNKNNKSNSLNRNQQNNKANLAVASNGTPPTPSYAQQKSDFYSKIKSNIDGFIHSPKFNTPKQLNRALLNPSKLDELAAGGFVHMNVPQNCVIGVEAAQLLTKHGISVYVPHGKAIVYDPPKSLTNMSHGLEARFRPQPGKIMRLTNLKFVKDNEVFLDRTLSQFKVHDSAMGKSANIDKIIATHDTVSHIAHPDRAFDCAAQMGLSKVAELKIDSWLDDMLTHLQSVIEQGGQEEVKASIERLEPVVTICVEFSHPKAKSPTVIYLDDVGNGTFKVSTAFPRNTREHIMENCDVKDVSTLAVEQKVKSTEESIRPGSVKGYDKPKATPPKSKPKPEGPNELKQFWMFVRSYYAEYGIGTKQMPSEVRDAASTSDRHKEFFGNESEKGKCAVPSKLIELYSDVIFSDQYHPEEKAHVDSVMVEFLVQQIDFSVFHYQKELGELRVINKKMDTALDQLSQLFVGELAQSTFLNMFAESFKDLYKQNYTTQLIHTKNDFEKGKRSNAEIVSLDSIKGFIDNNLYTQYRTALLDYYSLKQVHTPAIMKKLMKDTCDTLGFADRINPDLFELMIKAADQQL